MEVFHRRSDFNRRAGASVPNGSCPTLRHLPPYMRTAPQTLERIAGLSEQFSLFADSSRVPEGLRHATDFVSPEVEQELIAEIARLPLQPFQFGAYGGQA